MALENIASLNFHTGNYRWVAQVVSADPNNQPARDLLADALEQLGYQSENASWRNFFLTGAQELRKWAVQGSSPPDVRGKPQPPAYYGNL